MLRRLLNIASIVCLVVCVALLGMWVRSYYWSDKVLERVTERGVLAYTLEGRLAVSQYSQNSLEFPDRSKAWVWSSRHRTGTFEYFSSGLLDSLGFSWSDYSVTIPFWFLVLTTGSLAMAFQLRWPWRFNLRSLFVLTTFLAVVLGMIAWLDRAWIGK
jgi:hypothetical protein